MHSFFTCIYAYAWIHVYGDFVDIQETKRVPMYVRTSDSKKCDGKGIQCQLK